MKKIIYLLSLLPLIGVSTLIVQSCSQDDILYEEQIISEKDYSQYLD